MANIYVRSTDGSDSDNGSTWALAKATLAGAAAIAAAGDTIYVSPAHAESSAAAINIVLPGTMASPCKVLCVNDSAEPPTALATTATVTSTSSSYVAIGGSAYIYGIHFKIGTGGGQLYLNNTEGRAQHFEQCIFTINTSATSSNIFTYPSNYTAAGQTDFTDCSFMFGRADLQAIVVLSDTKIKGGSVDSTSDLNTYHAIFNLDGSGESGKLVIDGFDFSQAGTAFSLAMPPVTLGALGRFTARNCKLPTSWTGSLCSPTGTSISMPGWRAEMFNCDSGDTNYRMQVQTYYGSARDETTIKRTGGASDGTTGLSWKVVTTSIAEYPVMVFDAPEIVQWNETTGSAITVTVEIVTDNVTLKDDECWLEVQYLGTSGVPKSSFVDDCKADFMATAANQTSSSETWTTTGLTTPVKQKLSVSFTPQEKGWLQAVVKVAKASTTVYVDPLLVVT